ncbi:hypothetical protein NUW54_g3276 [Trametes sanguinea]|uniref:Uncharacterized protein n=1 Tax=Trametes sanguinea TaxID=158606 RepID=A0ACC1Q2E2_9APHY|nr:hypothetical protein NUW54_g3276 [Trametes sanguinea]
MRTAQQPLSSPNHHAYRLPVSITSSTMSSPVESSSWERSLPALPYDADERSMTSRSSSFNRVFRRIGISSRGSETSSHLGDYNARSMEGLDKSAASLSASTFSEGASSRSGRRLDRRSRHEKTERDVADMLEDDNLAWGAPPSKWLGRKN